MEKRFFQKIARICCKNASAITSCTNILSPGSPPQSSHETATSENSVNYVNYGNHVDHILHFPRFTTFNFTSISLSTSPLNCSISKEKS